MDVELVHQLCAACGSITYEDLLGGFDHPLPYADMLESAKRCRLCRLFVFSFSKLQLSSPYMIEHNYDSWVPQLLTTRYVRRGGSLNGILFEDKVDPPERLSWIPHSNASKFGIEYGSANDGGSIQVYAPQRMMDPFDPT